MPVWFFYGAPAGTNKVLSGLSFVLDAQPFVYVPAKKSIDLMTMDYSSTGGAFVSYARG